MPQNSIDVNAPVTSHSLGSRAILNKNHTSIHRALCGAVQILPPRTGPV